MSELEIPIQKENEKVYVPEAENSEAGKRTVGVIHTYAGDMAQMMREKDASVTSIALAELSKKEKETSIAPKKNHLFLILGISALILGIAAVGYIFYKGMSLAPVPVARSVSNLIFTETSKAIAVDNLSADEMSQAIDHEAQTANIKLDTIEGIFPVTTNAAGEKEMLPFAEFFAEISANAPPKLARALLPTYLLGIHNFEGNDLFLLLKTKNYEQTFAGMLEWEPRLWDNLYKLFNINLNNITAGKENWTDEIILNKDARVLRGNDGKIEILYLFIDRETLILAKNPSTIKEVIDRLYAETTAR